MEETRKRKRRVEAHAKRLAIRAIDQAGSRRNVAKATGRAEGTISHEATDRPHPEIYRLLCQLIGSPGCSGRALVESFQEALELHAIVTADDDEVLEQTIWLLDQEPTRDAEEDTALALGQVEHAKALRRYVSLADWLAMYEMECEYRGIDARAEWVRRRKGEAA